MSENQQVEWKSSWRREYYYRSGSTKQVLKGAALDRFLLGKTGRQWDAVPVPGELPENWSAANLLGPHPSQPCNPDIANAFFRTGDIEAWVRGIERVLEACRQASVPQPRIYVEPGDFWFEFPFSEAYLELIGGGSAEVSGRTTQETTQERIWLERLGERFGEKLGETEGWALGTPRRRGWVASASARCSPGVRYWQPFPWERNLPIVKPTFTMATWTPDAKVLRMGVLDRELS